MAKAKYIIVKKQIVPYIENRFPDFRFENRPGKIYSFRRVNEDNLYDYILVNSEFFEGKIILKVSEVATCYNKSSKYIPNRTLGKGTSIGVLITGKNYYPANTGNHTCENNDEDLNRILVEIGDDIDRYVMGYFKRCHEELNHDRQLLVARDYLQSKFDSMSFEEAQAIRDAWEGLGYLHPVFEEWIEGIQKELRLKDLSESLRTKLVRFVILYFADVFELNITNLTVRAKKSI